MRSIYINYENRKATVMFLGVAFAGMCVKLLFRLTEQAFPDTRLEAREISVNGQSYSERISTAFETEDAEQVLSLSLGHIERHGAGYENLYDIRFRLAILQKSEGAQENVHSIGMDIDLKKHTFSAVSVDDTFRDVVTREGILLEEEEAKGSDIQIPELEKTSNLENLLAELDALPGLNNVKKEIATMLHLVRMRKLRDDRGMKTTPLSLHMVFSGNPGTGKTTVARLLAKIYKEMGVLSKGQLVEADRSDLVSRYIGGTAIKVREIVDRAMGGILFIDEAYALTDYRGENDFGPEAFLNSNPGLRSCFNRFLKFEDYNPKELEDIFVWQCRENEYTVGRKCREYVRKYFEKQRLEQVCNFANGRAVRNLFEKAVANQADRLAFHEEITDQELIKIKRIDVAKAVLPKTKEGYAL